VTIVSVSALVWFGARLLDQERMVEAQRAQERLEQAADRITATARGALAETGERLGDWLISPPVDGRTEDGLVLLFAGDSLSAIPRQRLLFRPSDAPDAAEFADAFAEGEALEFQQALPERALERYRALKDSKNPATRAGALVRMARVLRKMGRSDEARAVYLGLANDNGMTGKARIADVPAELIARHELCELSGSKDEANRLARDLLQARWPLTHGQFAWYWSEAARLSGKSAALPAEAAAFSEAVTQAWNEIGRQETPAGQSTVWIGDQSWFLVWRSIPGRRAVLVTRPASLLKSICPDGSISCAAVDSEGRVVAGRRTGSGHAVIRTAAETHLPWALYMTAAPGSNDAGMLSRQRFLLLVTAITALFLIAGAYFIGRAIHGELIVARMQSDFVAAVSHEFRSPLTSIRQLSEILAFGRIPNDAKRHVYYETLLRETTRLQRLVEGLLNFGRMEAGVRQYHFEPLDASALVSRVAAEFEIQIAATGRHIEIEDPGERCTIDADPEALSVALRNLVDNALKYAPDCPTVRVKWGVEQSHVAIRVCDRGPGIPPSEKRAIFRKFVRGSAAEAANVKGSGVGLAMVRHIVAAHGGVVTLASEPGAGSEFTILLPLGADAR
jgi:signal transduction histidine kinase